MERAGAHLAAWSETTRVRLASRAAALIVAALVLSLFAQRIPTPGFGADLNPGAPHVAAVAIEIAPRPHVRPVLDTPSPTALVVASAAPATAAEGEALRLWRDGPAGEVVFRDAEQYLRCREARANRTEAPDCPSHTDTRTLVLASNAES